MSEWSEAAAAELATHQESGVATATVYEADRLSYAAEIRRIRESRGKTVS